ncbi:hypothetical protein H6764_01150, partial [Candidatus Nomurabacteria bacterium]|nr:hypothetical protein [Candidatus Nomurabacteria bacterium]
VAVNPNNWEQVYVYTEKDGFFISPNGGATWEQKNEGLPPTVRANAANLFPNLLTIDKTNPGTLYLNVNGTVYRTTNTGTLWTQISNGTTVDCSPLGQGSASNIAGVVVDEINSSHLWAATVASGCKGGIFEVTDYNANQAWSWIAGQNNTSGMNNDGWELVQSKANSQLLYSASVHGVARKSTDGGKTWSNIVPQGIGDLRVSIRPSPSDVNYLLAFAGQKVFYSNNQGQNWTAAKTFPSAVADLQFSESTSSLVYLTSGGHLYRSQDKGVTWSKVDQLNSPVALKAIVINRSDAQKLYVTTGGDGIYKTTNGGNDLAKTEGTNLPNQVEARSLLFSPDGSYALTFVSGQGVYRLGSGSSVWQLQSSSFEVSSSYQSYIHPLNKDYVYVSASLQDLYISKDAGVNWENISPNETGGFRSFAVDPTDPDTIITASSIDKKIYKTTNAGNSWNSISPKQLSVESMAIKPDNTDVIYIAGLDGLWKSTDGGVNWEDLYTPNQDIFGTGNAGIRFEVIDLNPEQPDQVYAANRSNKAFISEDGGNTWKILITGSSNIGRATFSAHDPNLIYTSDPYKIYQIEKNGSEYSSSEVSLEGINQGEFIQSKYFGIVENPSKTSVIYASTGKIYVYGDSVDEPPVTPPSATIEDILASYGSYNANLDQNGDGIINGIDFAYVASNLQGPPLALSLDCLDNSDCPSLSIDGTAPFEINNNIPSPFSGFADPTIRKDPASNRLWMAYSWPNMHINSPTDYSPAVDINYAHSDDGGDTWTFDGSLWPSVSAVNPVNGDSGYIDHEVANILPVEENNQFKWYGVRLDYFIPESEGFGQRPIGSFLLKVTRADSVVGLKTSETATLAGRKGSSEWGIDQYLSDLNAASSKCEFWNEPALYYENNKLYLVARCIQFARNRKDPDTSKSDLLVFSTAPTGAPSEWNWSYEGKLAGTAEATELGSGDGLTQVDIAKGQDGQLLAIVTPDIYDPELNDYVHYGCRAVEINSLDTPGFRRDGDGKIIVRAVVTASDLVERGPAACSYDPASSTGIIMTRRDKTDITLIASLHSTGLKP